MSDLQIVLRDMGILDAAEAKAKALGTSIEEALRMWVCDEAVHNPSKPAPGTIAFYNAVCARLTGDARMSYLQWKDKAEEVAGHTLEPMGVYLYAISGKVATSLITDGELDTIEGAVDYVLGQ